MWTLRMGGGAQSLLCPSLMLKFTLLCLQAVCASETVLGVGHFGFLCLDLKWKHIPLGIYSLYHWGGTLLTALSIVDFLS